MNAGGSCLYCGFLCVPLYMAMGVSVGVCLSVSMRCVCACVCTWQALVVCLWCACGVFVTCSYMDIVIRIDSVSVCVCGYQCLVCFHLVVRLYVRMACLVLRMCCVIC